MLIVTISPSTFNMEETISSLNFASRAMKIQNKPIINKTIDFMKLANKLQNELDKLNDQYTQLKMNYDTVLNENRRIKNGEIYIELQRKSLLNSIGTTRRNSANNIYSPHNNAINTVDVINNSTYEFEIKKLDEYYDTTLKAKVKEYQDILLEVDKIMLDKENEIDQLRNENNALKNKVQTLNETNSELQKQNEDLIKRLSELTYKLEQVDNENNSNSNINNNHGKTIEQLENTISQLEKSNANLLSINREVVATYIQNTSTKLKSLFEKKKDLKKELSQVILNTSKNDIMIKINNEEKDLIDNGGELNNNNSNNINTNMMINYNNGSNNNNSLSQRNQAISKLNLEKQELYKLNEHNFKLKHSLSSQIDLIEKEIDKYQNMYSHYSNIYEDTNNNIISHNNTNTNTNSNNITSTINGNGLHTQQSLLLEKDKTYYACECIKHQIEIEYLNKKLTAISSVASSNANTNQYIQYKVKCNENSFTLNCEDTNFIYTNNNKAKIEDLKNQVHKLETIVNNIQNELNDKNDYINEINEEKEKFLEENKLLLSKQSLTDNICTQLSRQFTDYNINLDKFETYININGQPLSITSKTTNDINSLLHTLNPKQYQQIIIKQFSSPGVLVWQQS
jgi:chromosome segregation ATPase